MMAELSAWLLRKHCLQHADPIFDRDESGRAVFRCPECLHAWPILPGYQPRAPRPAPALIVVREQRPPAEKRHRPVAAASTQLTVVSRPSRISNTQVM